MIDQQTARKTKFCNLTIFIAKWFAIAVGETEVSLAA
jgi:hypothetical protein